MGRKSGFYHGGYHPRIFHMKFVQGEIERIMEEKAQEAYMQETKKKLRVNYWQCREMIAMDALKHFDADWEVWFDDDANVPEKITRKERVLLVEARLKAIGAYQKVTCVSHREIFVFSDASGSFFFSKEVGKEVWHWMEFESMLEAKQFIDALLFDNLGFGWTLDVLPKHVGVTQ